jgi:hypothetical protein
VSVVHGILCCSGWKIINIVVLQGVQLPLPFCSGRSCPQPKLNILLLLLFCIMHVPLHGAVPVSASVAEHHLCLMVWW